jgi:exo-beta-1,3-glucanase (GH17 family)
LGILSIIAATTSFSATRYVPFGVNFSPYENGQDPNTGVVLKQSEVSSRLGKIRGRSQWVRTYSTTHGMETAGVLAHKEGFKIAQGAWLGSEADSAGAGLAANQLEIANLIAAANRGEVDVAVVGNEVLQSGTLSSSELVAYIQQVRSAVPAGIPVATVDTYGALLANTNVLVQSDIVMANFYPYWEGSRIDGAIAYLDGEYRELVQAAGSKEVWLAETGWPSGGDSVDFADASPLNAAYYFLAFNSWAQANNVKSFYFEAYDEAWKTASEGSQGAYWGIRNATGALKPGMNLVYQGNMLPQEIYLRPGQNVPPPPAPVVPPSPPVAAPTNGPISIALTAIPAYGASGSIAGVVAGVQPAYYDVATYIYIPPSLGPYATGWWTKPSWDQPTVPIDQYGRFSCDIVTGGVDSDATEIEAFVVPAGYSPPLADQSPSVPADVFSHAVASVDFKRPTDFPGLPIPTNTPPPPPSPTPTNPAAPITSFGSLVITRSFNGSPHSADMVSIAGDLSTDTFSDAAAQGAAVTVNIGSAYWQFAPLSTNGVSTTIDGSDLENASGRLSFALGKGTGAFSASLKCAPGNTNWDGDGLLNATIMPPGIPVFMRVAINVAGQYYTNTAPCYYTALQGKRGMMKQNRPPGVVKP